MRKIWIIISLFLALLHHTDSQTTATYTWINTNIMFDYPANWVVRDDTQRYEAISLATSQAMLDANEIPPQEAIFQVNVPISASPAALAAYDLNLGDDGMTVVDAFSLLGVRASVQVFSLDGRDVARVEHIEGEQMAVFLLIEGQDIFYFVYGAFQTADQAQFEPLLFDLLTSIRPAESTIQGGGRVIEQNIPAQTPTGVIWQQQQPFDRNLFEALPTNFGRLAIAADDTLYIATGTNAILELAPTGELTRIIQNDLIHIADLALDSDGSFWVIDPWQQKVYHLSPDGDVLSSFGTFGTAPDQFGRISPLDIVLAPNDQIYLFVTQVFGSRTYDEIQIWSKDGQFIDNILIQARTEGFQDSSLLMLQDETLYVYAFSDMLVQQYNLDGELLQTLLQPPPPRAPTSMAVDSSGRVFFATSGIIRVYENGERVLTFGDPGINTSGEIPAGMLIAPRGMGFLSNGDLVVVDANQSHWQVIRLAAP
ncbi:MAG: hypothetical protein CUN56_05245 [Phototrophicales bacterium]|nr:MAG: hypothetical protein CUN56_05245 [Phototrophicales bacterium]